MIKLQVIGHLGRDAIINTVNEKTVINFSVAHTERYKDHQGNKQEKTTWVDCAYWTDKKVGPYLLKGTLVFVEGTPEVKTYNKKDNTQGFSLSMRVLGLELHGSSGERKESEPANTTSVSSSSQGVTEVDDSDPLKGLPF
jgi:single-strand DNA-binding protein